MLSYLKVLFLMVFSKNRQNTDLRVLYVAFRNSEVLHIWHQYIWLLGILLWFYEMLSLFL